MNDVVSAVALALIGAQGAQVEPVACADHASAQAEVERTIHQFFDALRGEGDVPFEELTTQSMYSFDVGERFNGRSLADLITQALADGVEINWSLGPTDTKIRCNVAWSQWENTGSAGTPPNVTPVRWLESAVLVHDEGRWKIDFFHSQRARDN